MQGCRVQAKWAEGNSLTIDQDGTEKNIPCIAWRGAGIPTVLDLDKD